MTSTQILHVDGATSRAANGTTLLDDVSFTVDSGSLVAVVGPTGAGKTSLAKALLGQLHLDAGTVRVTGRGGKGRVAGVPQDDTTHAQLTLRRTLDHAASLRLGAGPLERRRKVDAVLAELGLSGRASSRLDQLSGGERKRANVAVELLGEPDLLVLDEPTAGLDPAFERSVFASLRSLADAGRTIVAITHSVQALSVCDRVLFLAPGGSVAFFGSPSEAQAFFDWNEPADAYAAVATAPQAWRDRFSTQQASRSEIPGWRTSVDPPAAVPAPAAAPRPGSSHLGTLLRRSWHLASSDRRSLLLSLAAGPILGLLLWAVLPGAALERTVGSDGPASSGGSAATFAFFLAMAITWLAAAGAAREVVKERDLVRRERLVGVSLSSYLLGKGLFLSAVTAVQVVPLAAIAVLRQKVPGRGPALGSALVEILVVAVVVGVAAVATGLLVSTWSSTSEKAMTALPVVLIAQLALAGPWADERGPVIGFVRDLIPARWASVAVEATVAGDAGRWWLSVSCVAGSVVLMLAAALLLLRRSSSPATVPATRSLDALGNRLATASPPQARFVPVGLAMVLALAAGVGALGRSAAQGGRAQTVSEVAMETPARVPVAAPAPTAVPPPTTAAPAPSVAAPAAAPAPAAPVAAPRPAATTPRRTSPPSTSPLSTTPTTAPPATAPAAPAPPPPPAATAAPLNVLALPGQILQQVLQPLGSR